jgi:hypothetical protein
MNAPNRVQFNKPCDMSGANHGFILPVRHVVRSRSVSSHKFWRLLRAFARAEPGMPRMERTDLRLLQQAMQRLR